MKVNDIKTVEQMMSDIKGVEKELSDQIDASVYCTIRYKENIDKLNDNLRMKKDILLDNLKDMGFKTKTGGVNFNLLPHIGEVSAKKKTTSWEIEDKKVLLEKGFIKYKVEIDKSCFNKEFKPSDYKNIEGTFVNQVTGEVMPEAIQSAVSLKSTQNLSIAWAKEVNDD